MPRAQDAPGFPIALRQLPLLLKGRRGTIQETICEALLEAIQQGRLQPGSRLPPSRDLARQLQVARGTVVLAYQQLTAEGYLRGAGGAGTSVVESLPERALVSTSAGARASEDRCVAALSRRGERLARSPFALECLEAPRPYRPLTPAVEAFPVDLWARLLARHARSPRPDRLRDVDARGYLPLREAIAEHVRVYRGVTCTADRVVVATGTQQLIDLVSRLLLDEGDAVWIEDPGHFGAREVLRAAGARLVPVPVDAEGLVVERAVAEAPEARLAYVTPARQSPLGSVMSLERRARLLEWAQARSAWIFENDSDSEFRYEGRPLPALQGLDSRGAVIFCGTFSKTMFPGLRLAFAVLPDALVDPFASALSLLSRYAPLLPQLALCDFITEGHFARHLRRMRMLYAERREALLAALRSELAGQIELEPSSAGMELVAWLPPGLKDRAVARAGLELGIELLPLSLYAMRPLERGGLVLGFSAVSAARSRKAVPQLQEALRQAQAWLDRSNSNSRTWSG